MGKILPFLFRRTTAPAQASERPPIHLAPEPRTAFAAPGAGREQAPPARGPAVPLPVGAAEEMASPLLSRALTEQLVLRIPLEPAHTRGSLSAAHPLDIPAALASASLVAGTALALSLATLPWRMALDSSARMLEEW